MSARSIAFGVWFCGDQGTSETERIGQLPALERPVVLDPAELGRALGAGVAELQADLGVGLGVDEVDDALPGGLGSGAVGAGAAGADPALGGHAGHLGVDEPGAALGALAEVDEVPVGRHAVHGLVLRHRRDDDAVLQLHAAQAEGREHRPADRGVGAAAGAGSGTRLGAVQPVLVAQPQVLVADALRAGEQRVGELHRVEVEVALDLLEPLHRVARGRLEAEHVEAAGVLVLREGGLEGRLGVQVAGERDGAVEREAGAGADGEMRGGGGVAHQDDVAVGPLLAEHAGEVDPGRAADVAGVGDEGVAAELVREDRLAGGDQLLLGHLAEAVGVPGGLGALDDEGRGVGVELVGVRPEPALLGLLEDEGEGVVELLPGAEPDELALAHVDVGLEVLGVAGAGQRVQPVAGDDDVVVARQLLDLVVGDGGSGSAGRRRARGRGPGAGAAASSGRCRRSRGRRRRCARP